VFFTLRGLMSGHVERDVECGCQMSLEMSCVEWFG
jgi:hypothetical protein